MKKLSIFFAEACLLVAFDQLTKLLAVIYLKGTPGIVLVPGVFELYYLENRGAAWGMFSGMHWLFFIFTLLLIAGVIYCLNKMPDTRKYRAFRILSAFLAGGALGNAFDRLFRDYVVDFFYFSLIDFPVFNVADCFICVSLALIIILYRNEDFAWMKKS